MLLSLFAFVVVAVFAATVNDAISYASTFGDIVVIVVVGGGVSNLLEPTVFLIRSDSVECISRCFHSAIFVSSYSSRFTVF